MGLRVRRVDEIQWNKDDSDDHKIRGPRGAGVPEMVVPTVSVLTSNHTVALATCAICEQKHNMHEDQVKYLSLNDIPDPWHLYPHTDNIHPTQHLVNSMLFEKRGLIYSKDLIIMAIRICRQCKTSLHKRELTIPPKYSLANNLWVGDILWELHTLTVPEQQLITLLYPHVFVHKLMPKSSYNPNNQALLQNGIRGTVSTYKQDT